jgi:nucleoside phosphorylase
VCYWSAGQGSTKSALATKLALDEYDPSLVLFVGTAAGRESKTSYLDVVLATAVLDASEWRTEPGGVEPQWEEKFEPPRESAHDIDVFGKKTDWHERCHGYLKDAASVLLAPKGAAELPEGWPHVHDDWVVTTGFLPEDPDFLERIWGMHARLRVVDMESAGFARACKGDRAAVVALQPRDMFSRSGEQIITGTPELAHHLSGCLWYDTHEICMWSRRGQCTADEDHL